MPVQSQTNGHFLLLCRGIVFLVPNLRRAFQDDEEARVNLVSSLVPETNMVRPTVAFGFPSHRVVLYLQQSKQISCPQIPGIPGAGPGSASQQAGEDYAAESSTVCTNEALITFRYFLKPHSSDFRYKLCQVAPPSFKSVSIGKATLDYLPWQNFLQQTLLLKPPLVCLSWG